MKTRFRFELRKLIKQHGIDTDLNAPDWFIEDSINSFLETIKGFSVPSKYAPLNNMVGTILQPTTAQGQNGTAGKPQVVECTTSAIA